MVAHLLQGVGTAAFIYPLISDHRRLDLKRRWSAKLLEILGVHLETSLAGVPAGSLLVANHISWLDIYVINATLPAAFVSKAEVRQWPLIGWLAARTDTIFLRRGSRGHARVINAEIAAVLLAGKHVALFPEGTTTDGGSLLHFHGALLQPAIEIGHPIVPLALSYHDGTGQRSIAPAYVGDTSLWQSLRSILAARGLKARIEAGSPLNTEGSIDRKGLAAAARWQIASRIFLSEEN